MKYCYCICYIERKYYKGINEELKRKGYKNITAIIPEVRVIKKSIRNTTFYDDVPVLFNYGFIRMPIHKAYSRMFLIKLRKDISGIRNWLRSVETMFPREKKKRIDNSEDFDDFSKVAICTKEEVDRFKKIAKQNQIYSLEDRLSIKSGQYITLKIYPYEGLSGVILSINHKSNDVTISIDSNIRSFIVNVPFDHVLYSVYKDYDPDTFIRPYELDTERIIDKES